MLYQSERLQSAVEQLSRINPFYGKKNLPEPPPRPDEKTIPRDAPSKEQIPCIQKQLDLLTYNHLPYTLFNLDKHRTLQSILMTGKEALTEALPIRCLEATFVGMYLTQENKDIDRIPLSFRSCVNGNYYQHIVLVVHLKQPTPLYGALGLSRKRTLMYKPLHYRSLYEVVMDYKREYEALGHELIDIKLGLSVPHDAHCRLIPCWRFVALKFSAFDEPRSPAQADAHQTSSPNHASAPAAPPLSLQSSIRPASRSSATSSPCLAASVEDTAKPLATPAVSLGASALIPPVTAPAQHPSHRTVSSTEPIFDGNSEPDSSIRLSGTLSTSPAQGKLSCTPTGIGRVSWPPHASPSSSVNTTPITTQVTGAAAADVPAGAGAGAAETCSPPAVCSTSKPPQKTFGSSFRGPAREETSRLAQFLGRYTRLLPVMSEQYCKGLPTVENASRVSKLCFMSLEEAERDAKMENNRRIALVSKLQSPLSSEARKMAANRQLKSEQGRKRRSRSRPRRSEQSPANGKRSAGVQGSPRGTPLTNAPATTASARATARKSPGMKGFSSPCIDTSASGESSTVVVPRSVITVRAEAPQNRLHMGNITSSTAVATHELNSCLSPQSLPSLPPTPRNGSAELAMGSGGSLPSSSSSSSDDSFLMDEGRGEGSS